ncbi:hypothetical protein [Aliivibrio fischeri]|uniref:hypothetical protein n=1 Tax=Aliivibrio fischeri TaxID=668 RepID=UPI001F3741C0|nr:hypothetical protein [Aliivibrio fischeri]MCE4935194.1 hypothetical protein [Aliivibrio fischeri]
MIDSGLSKHAEKRLFERTFFNEKSINNLIVSKSYFLLGREVNSNVVHCLVYQENTNEYFVVIKNELSNILITILPLEYHAKFESKLIKEYVTIDSEIKRRARLGYTSSLTCDDLKLKIKLKADVVDKYGLRKVCEIKNIKFSLDEYIKYTRDEKKAMNILMRWIKKNKTFEVVGLSLSIGRESEVFNYNV